MFKRAKNNNITKTSANTLLNRIVTYGLVIFFAYALYQNGSTTKKNVTLHGKTPELNYTPVSFGNGLMLKNQLTGQTQYFDLDMNHNIALELTPDDLKKLKGKKDVTQVFGVEFLPKQSCDVIINDRRVLTYPRQR